MAKKKKQEEEEDEKEEKQDLSDGSVAVNDAWTGMLAISLLALAGSAGLLLWDYLKYDIDPTNAPKPSALIGAPPKMTAPTKDGGAAKKDDAKDKDGKKDAGKDMGQKDGQMQP